MGLCMCDGKFVNRNEVALINTPTSTETWKPVPHIEVIQAVTEVITSHDWLITSERYGLAHDGQKLFGVMEINKSSSPDWIRSIGIRNSHDKSFSAGITAGISVLVCSNLAFGGTTVIKRRHTSRFELTELIARAVESLENEFLITESVCEEMKVQYL